MFSPNPITSSLTSHVSWTFSNLLSLNWVTPLPRQWAMMVKMASGLESRIYNQAWDIRYSQVWELYKSRKPGSPHTPKWGCGQIMRWSEVHRNWNTRLEPMQIVWAREDLQPVWSQTSTAKTKKSKPGNFLHISYRGWHQSWPQVRWEESPAGIGKRI